MGEDKEWVAVYKVVLEALADGRVLEDPPTTEEEVEFLAETISDHVVGAFRTALRRS